DVRDPDAHLNGERPRQGLADCDALAHLLLGEPFPLAHHLALHLADEGHRPPEAEEAQAEVVAHEVSDGDAWGWRVGAHRSLLGKGCRSVTLDEGCSKRYFIARELADAPDHVASHAHPAPRGGVAKAPAPGGDPSPRLGMDPARDAGHDGAIPVARPGNRVLSWRGDPPPRGTRRQH